MKHFFAEPISGLRRLMAMKRIVPLLVLLLAGAARAEEQELEADQVLITAQISLGKAQVSGVSRSLEWSAQKLSDGAMQVKLQVPVASFETGHPEVDSLLRSVAGPDVVVEGTARGEGSSLRFEGTVRLNGATQPLKTQLLVARGSGAIAVYTSFAIDLTRFGIEPPAGMGKTVAVEFAAHLRQNPAAALSVGMVRAR